MIGFERWTNYATDAANSGFGNVSNVPEGDIDVQVEIRGQKFIVYVNGAYLTTWTNPDNTYTSGHAAVYAYGSTT